MCITRVSQGRVGAGRTVGLWEGSVCLVHPGVPTASTGEPQTRLHTQGDTLRLHSPLQPGVWGVYHHKPQKQPRALCPGSTAGFAPSGPPRASPAIRHLLQGHGTHLWTDTHGRCSLMASHVALLSSRLGSSSCCVGRFCAGEAPSLWHFLFLFFLILLPEAPSGPRRSPAFLHWGSASPADSCGGDVGPRLRWHRFPGRGPCSLGREEMAPV